MNISGFEISQAPNSEFCHNAYCSAVIPLCFAGVSPGCARNRSNSKWYHLSFGEHVCSPCFEFLDVVNQKHRSQQVDAVWRHRITSWRREWLRKCSRIGRRKIPSTTDFIASHLLPWWIKCNKCGRWRQVAPQTPVGCSTLDFHPSKFCCANVVKISETPCSWIVDERSLIVQNRPQDFLASMQTHAWLQASPAQHMLSSYGLDLSGLSPDLLPGFTMDNQSQDKEYDCQPFDENGVFSPIDILAWERLAFAEMTRFPTLYLAVRNLIICLWSRNTKCLLTSQFVSQHCFIRGLLRIILCDHWIPHLIKELTFRGLINLGLCNLNGLDFVKSTSSLPPLNIRLVGCLDLTSSVIIRQLRNASLLSHVDIDFVKHDSTLHGPPLSIKHHAYTSESLVSVQDSISSLVELSIRFSKSNKKLSTSKNNRDFDPERITHGLARHFTVSVPSDLAHDLPNSLSLPANAYTDRIYAHSNHPVSVMASQVGLRVRPFPNCTILQSSINSETGKLELSVIPPDKCVRMEFHVEAILDLVSQYSRSVLNDSISKASLRETVQERWDIIDLELKTRLPDLVDYELEKSLAEFYLAAVEYDLTEPLTTNLTRLYGRKSVSNHSYPTARLDQLPACFFSESVIEDSHLVWDSSIENHSPFNPYVIELPEDCKTTQLNSRSGAISYLGSSLLMENDLNLNKINNNQMVTTVIASRTQANVTGQKKSTQQSDSNATKTNLLVVTREGTCDSVDWAILTLPTNQIQLIFDAESMELSNGSNKVCTVSSRMNSSLLPIHLPSCIRSLILEDASADSGNMIVSKSVNSLDIPVARLLTVTLIYSSPWWRYPLDNLKLLDGEVQTSCTESANEHKNLTWIYEHFAFLPKNRDDRGFCHTFRDLCPKLNNPGVLQTQIFAATADHWWAKADLLIEAAVDNYLRTALICPSASDFCDNRIKLLFSHVSRIQYPHLSSPEDPKFPDQLCVFGESGHLLHLKPSAWLELARTTGIIIPSLICENPTNAVSGKFKIKDGCGSMTIRSSEMDAITSAVHLGLELADLALHLISQSKIPFSLSSRYLDDQFKYNTNSENGIDEDETVSNPNLLDSRVKSNGDYSSDDELSTSTTNKDDHLDYPTARTKRLLKRRRIDCLTDL